MHVLKQYQDLNLATSKLISRTKIFIRKIFLKMLMQCPCQLLSKNCLTEDLL